MHGKGFTCAEVQSKCPFVLAIATSIQKVWSCIRGGLRVCAPLQMCCALVSAVQHIRAQSILNTAIDCTIAQSGKCLGPQLQLQLLQREQTIPKLRSTASALPSTPVLDTWVEQMA